MDSLFKVLVENYGPLGLVISCLAWMVWRFDKQLLLHRDDRNRWLADSERLTNKMIDSLNANTEALTEVVTILKERGK